MPLFEIKLVHVFMQIKKSYTLISLGREGPFDKEGTLWLLESKFVTNFEWDPNEWFWGRLGTRIPVPFYQYIFRIKYQSITRCEGMESIITTFHSKERMKTKHIIRAFNQF
jgi:hypothetical protein